MEWSYEDFRHKAMDPTLSRWEKTGFPDSYRAGYEHFIWTDIAEKLDLNNVKAAKILDIGAGCNDLTEYIINECHKSNHDLTLVDSPEMLDILSNQAHKVNLIPGYFPTPSVLAALQPPFDAIIVYSVIQYVFLEQSIFKFIHECLKMLKPNGRLLIGDIPNFQSRKRFLESEEGKKQKDLLVNIYNQTPPTPENYERIDDAVVLSILQRFRHFGCETYLLPQKKELPFANRREDILIIKR